MAALAFVVGVALRVHPIASRPLWYDEAFTWYVAEEHAYREWLQWRSREPKHPPLSFAVVAVSMKVLGSQAEWAVRAPGVAAGIFVIPAMFALGATLGGVPAGAVAATFAAVAPNMVDQGQQARMFSELQLLEIVALTAVIALLERVRARRRDTLAWIVSGVVLAAAFWTNQLSIAIWAGIGAGALAWSLRAGREIPHLPAAVVARLAIVFGVACVLSAPGIRSIIGQTLAGTNAGEPTSVAVATIVSEIWDRSLLLAGGPLGAAFVYPLAFFGVYREWKRGGPSAFVLGAVAVLGLAIMFPLRQRQPFLPMRYLSAVEPVLLATAAIGVVALSERARVAAVAVFVIVCGLALRGVALEHRDLLPRRTAVAHATVRLREHLRDGDLVVYHPEFDRLVGYYYGLPRNNPLHRALNVDRVAARPETLTVMPRPQRLWFISDPWVLGPDFSRLEEERGELRAFARWYGHAERGEAIVSELSLDRQGALVVRFDESDVVRVAEVENGPER
jgi:4-amino-4-deoxy-L-arabinose transferase-like glycosyltransferase